MAVNPRHGVGFDSLNLLDSSSEYSELNFNIIYMTVTTRYGDLPKPDYKNLAAVIIGIGLSFLSIIITKGMIVGAEYRENMYSYSPNTDVSHFDVNYDDWSVMQYEGFYYLRTNENIYQAHSLDQVIEIAQLDQ